MPQSTSYLDPLMKVGQQICKGKKTPEKKRKLDSIFEKYGLGKNVQEQYPFELSGGMTRRVMISTALIETPKLVIADEPTPGLDPKLARRAMEHFRELADMGAAVLVITHDLELALQTVDRIQVFYAGYTIEDSTAEDFAKEETLRHRIMACHARTWISLYRRSSAICKGYAAGLSVCTTLREMYR